MFPQNYYYETDCYTLNREARLYCPWPRRLADFLRQSFSYDPDLHNQALLLAHKQKHAAMILSKIETLQQEICWDQNLLDASYAIFDCETTGLHPLKGDEIISLGGVIIEKGKIVNERVFNQLINPLRPIPPTITTLTGITNPMVVKKPAIDQALPDFLDFLGNRILVAHHAAFDLTFLNLVLGRFAPVRIPQPVIDTYLLSRHIMPWFGEHTLDSLGICLDIKMNRRHTALGDALITAQLFLKLLNGLAEKNIFTLNQLRDYFLLKKNTEAPATIPAATF